MRSRLRLLTEPANLRILVWLCVVTLAYGLIVMQFVDKPSYTDAYYYYNAAERLADGDGLTDNYVWIFLNAPDELPAPSFTYWMPLYSLLSGTLMAIFGTHFAVAQIPGLLSLVGLVAVTAWLAIRYHLTRIETLVAGLVTMFGGLYGLFWLTTDNFALFGVLGSTTLLAIGYGRTYGHLKYFVLGGIMAGLASLTRGDGLLLVGVVALIAILPHYSFTHESGWKPVITVILSALIVMLPWSIRNLTLLDAPLAPGATGTAFLRGYEEFFAYPAQWSANDFFKWGIGNILESRLSALYVNSFVLIVNSGGTLLGIFAIVEIWRRRRDPMLLGVMLYASSLFLVMSLVFAYPGQRGAMFHSSAALLPFGIVFGLMGLNRLLNWIGERRQWKQTERVRLFVQVILVIGAAFIALARIGSVGSTEKTDYGSVTPAYVPPNAVVMVPDPPTFYYQVNMASISLPSNSFHAMQVAAERYCVTHVILTEDIVKLYVPMFLGESSPPAFLIEVAHLTQNTETAEDDIRVYKFDASSMDYAARCGP